MFLKEFGAGGGATGHGRWQVADGRWPRGFGWVFGYFRFFPLIYAYFRIIELFFVVAAWNCGAGPGKFKPI